MASGGERLMLSVSGMRGVMGATLTPEAVVRFAGALGAWLKARRARAGGALAKKRPMVVVSNDGRAGGADVYMIAASTLGMAGCDLAHLGTAMTPTVGVVVDHLSADAGLQVTASHNPQEWNGCKAIIRDLKARRGAPDACAPGKAMADELIALIRAMERGETARGTWAPWDGVGKPSQKPIHDREHLARVTGSLSQIKLVPAIKALWALVTHDSVAGSGSRRTAEFLKALGCRVDELYPLVDHPGGVFTHTPEPTREHLVSLSKAVKKARSAVGFAQDPDADRLAVVDERGTYIGEEYTLVLAAMALGEAGQIKKGAKIAVNLSTSRMIDDVAARYGAQVIRTAVGEANVVDAMKREKCVLGGEGNGGVIWPRVTYIRDSLSGMGLVLGLMAKMKQPLSAIVAGVPSYAIVKRKVDLPNVSRAAAAVDAVARAYARERVDRQDGVRVDFDARCAWLHVRASNTEPIMRLIAEAPTKREAEGILDEAAGVIG